MLTIKAVVQAASNDPNVSLCVHLGCPWAFRESSRNAKKSEKYAALNGCETRCASKALERAGIPYRVEFVLTKDLGIKKNKDLKQEEALPELLDKVSQTIKVLRKS